MGGRSAVKGDSGGNSLGQEEGCVTLEKRLSTYKWLLLEKANSKGSPESWKAYQWLLKGHVTPTKRVEIAISSGVARKKHPV